MYYTDELLHYVVVTYIPNLKVQLHYFFFLEITSSLNQEGNNTKGLRHIYGE